MLVIALLLLAFPLQSIAQQASSQQLFRSNCAACHGDDARGTAKGPGLAMNPRVAEQTADQLRAFLDHGNPGGERIIVRLDVAPAPRSRGTPPFELA